MTDIIVISLIAAFMGVLIFLSYRRKKSGKALGCGCGCSSCSSKCNQEIK